MKKYLTIIFATVIAILGVIAGACGYYDFLTDANLYRVLSGCSLALMGALLLAYNIITRKKLCFGAIINFLAITSISIGYIFLTSNYLVASIFMFVASVLIVARQFIKRLNLMPVIFISIAVSLPTTLVLIFANFYGFDSVLCQIANIFYMIAVSVV